MDTPLFTKEMIVEKDTQLLEVLDVLPCHTGWEYVLKPRAFLKNETTSIDYMHSSVLAQRTVSEQALKGTSYPKPRYDFNERVRWTDNRKETDYGIVKNIIFEDHRYKYRLLLESRKDEGYLMNYGHFIEESYISK